MTWNTPLHLVFQDYDEATDADSEAKADFGQSVRYRLLKFSVDGELGQSAPSPSTKHSPATRTHKKNLNNPDNYLLGKTIAKSGGKY